MKETKEMRVIFCGDVQSVGFRFFVNKLADQFQIVGYVKNTSNGNVEVRIQGEKDQINSFVEKIQKSSPGVIKKTVLQEEKKLGSYQTFEIRF